MKLMTFLMFLILSTSSHAVTFEELGDSLTDPIPPRTEEGVIRSIDMGGRKLVISGYEYLVGPSTINPPVKVSLFGTTAGSFELLSPGMKVEVHYIDFGNARVAFEINEVDPSAELEH